VVASEGNDSRMKLPILAYTLRTFGLISRFAMKKFLMAVLDLFDRKSVIVRSNWNIPAIDKSSPGMEWVGVQWDIISPTVTSDTFMLKDHTIDSIVDCLGGCH
jgi:hypothetical protein